jgi:hypothetical protein
LFSGAPYFVVIIDIPQRFQTFGVDPFGTVLQIIGVSLLSTMDNTNRISHAIYAYEVMTGLGIGFIFGLCLVIAPAVLDNKDPGE